MGPAFFFWVAGERENPHFRRHDSHPHPRRRLAVLNPAFWVRQRLAAPSQTSLSGNYLASRTAGRNRDTVEAADYLHAALKQDPGNPVLTERLFQLELANGQIAEAEKLAEKVI